LDTDEIIVITGPRQVGKTTTLHWILDQVDSPNKHYFDLENIRDREIFEATNYDDVVVTLQNLGLNPNERIYLAIDEIQLLKNLPSVVKYLYDHYHIKFFLTGSSSFYIKNRFSESMAGRKLIFEMLPLSFREFLDFKDISYQLPHELTLATFSTTTYNQLSAYYQEYVDYGGLPKVVLTADTQRKRQFLEEIFSSYINIDVQTLADFRSTRDLRQVIALLASRIGSRLNINQLAKITGLNRATLTNYIEFLQQTYLIRLIPIHTASTDVQLRHLTKPYFIDTGIASINAQLSSGSQFENTVCHQLSFYGSLSYHSTTRGEIDFILNHNQAFEVKEAPTDRDLGRLKKRSQALHINQYYLIGKGQTATFSDYLWGGNIG
jgi:hypothetical protein